MDRPAPAPRDDGGAGARRALMFGNFCIGCGVMVVAGSLNDLTRSLQVSVAAAGQLITVAAALIAVGAPLLAGLLARIDRRRLLAGALLWYAAGHLAGALMPAYAWLLPVRALGVVAAAVFTPQAAAAIAAITPVAQRGRAITFVFLGWSVASVIGMPLHSYIGEAFGWRWAFGVVAVLSLAGAIAVWRTLPDGIRPAPLTLQAWREVLTHPVLMAIVAVTALQSAGQFTLFAYFAPWARSVLGADGGQISLIFFWFGAFGLIGNVLLSRRVDRIGPARAVRWTIGLMGAALLAWPLAGLHLAVALLLIVPWGLGCFAANSAQQARLGAAAPLMAPALMALNTSAIYLGQAVGAANGGALLLAGGYGVLSWVGVAWMIAAWWLSRWADRAVARGEPL
jgi:predicted MFS family arabinose efflux permease